MSTNLETFQFTENADNATSSQGWIVSQGSVINALDGDDTIEGIGNVDSGILNYGTIYTGNGNDRIVGTYLYDDGIYNAGTIDTGNGNDVIYGTDIENDGTILTGDGDDIITGEGQLDNDFGAVINTGSGNDKIIFNQSTQNPYRSIWNDGLIDTGSGNDIVDALGGGFYGDTEGPPSGEIKLGDGEDTLIGFGTGGFFGGTGTDKILFGEGLYKVSESTIISDGRTMRVYEFEQIGGVNGGLFNYTNGTLTVDSTGIATFLSAFNNGNGTLASITGNGVFQEGVTLTAPVVAGDPDGDATNPNYSYQWFKGSTAITNATASTYAVPASGAGTYKVAVTYTDAQGFVATLDSPEQDILTGIKVLDSSTGATQVTGNDGIIDRFVLQTNSAPSTPFRITAFNPTEDILQIPQELASGIAQRTFFGVAKVVVPDRTLTKREQRSFKKQQKAVSKSVKRIGRSGDGFAYNQLTGELFVDTNGRKKGFGVGGGLLAVLEDTPAIGIDNFQFL